MTRLTFISVTLAATFAATGAMAAPKAPTTASKASHSVAPITVHKSVKHLPFGKGHKAALKWIERRMKRAKRPASVIKLQLKKLSSSIVAFTPKVDHTRWSASVIGDEFKVGNGESMLVWNDGKNVHYLFFHLGKLFKYAKPAAVPPTRLGFVDRVNTLSKSLGAPTGTVAPDGGDTVVEARWIKSRVETRIVDKRAKHNADVLLIEDAKLAATVLASRRGQVNEKTYEIDPALKEFLE